MRHRLSAATTLTAATALAATALLSGCTDPSPDESGDPATSTSAEASPAEVTWGGDEGGFSACVAPEDGGADVVWSERLTTTEDITLESVSTPSGVEILSTSTLPAPDDDTESGSVVAIDPGEAQTGAPLAGTEVAAGEELSVVTELGTSALDAAVTTEITLDLTYSDATGTHTIASGATLTYGPDCGP